MLVLRVPRTALEWRHSAYISLLPFDLPCTLTFLGEMPLKMQHWVHDSARATTYCADQLPDSFSTADGDSLTHVLYCVDVEPASAAPSAIGFGTGRHLCPLQRRKPEAAYGLFKSSQGSASACHCDSREEPEEWQLGEPLPVRLCYLQHICNRCNHCVSPYYLSETGTCKAKEPQDLSM